jgi:hypothetical protein
MALVGIDRISHFNDKRIVGMKTQKSRVIFLCCHNAVTSQMAEGFLRHYSGDRFEVFSAEQKGAA